MGDFSVNLLGDIPGLSRPAPSAPPSVAIPKSDPSRPDVLKAVPGLGLGAAPKTDTKVATPDTTKRIEELKQAVFTSTAGEAGGHPSGGMITSSGPMPIAPGPVTPEMIIGSGLPNAQPEAAAWAALANWITRGESARTGMGGFTELFNGHHWSGPDTDHPANLGWGGELYNGKPTHAYGLFQDEPGTWDDIAQKYLGGDKRITWQNQLKGNLGMAAALYKQRTGRDIITDFKGGNTVQIAQTLKDQWPTLMEAGSGGGHEVGPGQSLDPDFAAGLAREREAITQSEAGLAQLMKAAQAADPLSDAQHLMLTRAMKRSDDLAESYKRLSEKPPQPRTPMEAASAITPVLVFLAAMGGFATRRPALGAINAISGALEGLKAGNDTQYKNNIALWEKQTEFAHNAFQMQNESIRNIMEDTRLTAVDKQAKLQDAFRYWKMDSDLKMAKAGQWKEVWQEQHRREEAWTKAQTEIARTARDFAYAQKLAHDSEFGNLTGPAGAIVKTLVEEELQTHPEYNGDAKMIPAARRRELIDQAEQHIHSVQKPLTPLQIQKNESIEAAKAAIGPLPDNFDDLIRNNPKQWSDKDLKEKGLSPTQIELFKALLKSPTDPTVSTHEKELVKTYEMSKAVPLKPSRVLQQEQQGQPTGGQPQADNETLLELAKEAIDGGVDRAAVRARFIQMGGSADDFDLQFPVPEKAATPPGPPIDPLGLGMSPGLMG